MNGRKFSVLLIAVGCGAEQVQAQRFASADYARLRSVGDVRFSPDQAGTAPTSNPIGSGNTWVGLRSSSWGSSVSGGNE